MDLVAHYSAVDPQKSKYQNSGGKTHKIHMNQVLTKIKLF